MRKASLDRKQRTLRLLFQPLLNIIIKAIIFKMDLLCQGLNFCAPCCSNECKWVIFENKSESCHSSVRNLEDVVSMVEKVENCKEMPVPGEGEVLKDLSEVFGGLTGGFLLALICFCCYCYFRLTAEQRQRLGRIAVFLFAVMEFLVNFWRALRRQHPDQEPLLNDAENPGVGEGQMQHQLGPGNGRDNFGANLEDQVDDLPPNVGQDLRLAFRNEPLLPDRNDADIGGDEDDGAAEDDDIVDEQEDDQEAAGDETQDAPVAAVQGEQQGPLFVIGMGNQDNDSSSSEEEFLTPPNRTNPRPPLRPTPRRNPGRNSKFTSLNKLAALRRNRQI